jgi:hypothetical protein
MAKSSQVAAALFVIASPSPILAGMPMPHLTDIAAARLDTLSFFLAIYLASGWAVKAIWNGLRGEFSSFPYLTYKKALGVVTVWAALFVVVLTMISGARELLTPGAWEKVGLTYRVKGDEMPRVYEPPADDVRQAKLERLRQALWGYATSHNGEFPPKVDDPSIAPEYWATADSTGVSFAYIPGRKVHMGRGLVAYEPHIEVDSAYALFSNGEIRRLSNSELDSMIQLAKTP